MKYLGAITDDYDLVNKKYVDDSIPTVPTKTSDLTNDSGFITSSALPTKVSDLTNDSGFITTETDPTVPSWAKANSKPSYTAGEVGALPISGGTITGNLGVNGTLTVGSHTSAIGTQIRAGLSAAVSLTADTWTQLFSFSLPAGTWLIIAGFRCPSSSSGLRYANIERASKNTSQNASFTPSGNGVNSFIFTKSVTVTAATTFYYNVMSTVATSANAGGVDVNGAGYGTFYQAIRLL